MPKKVTTFTVWLMFDDPNEDSHTTIGVEVRKNRMKDTKNSPKLLTFKRPHYIRALTTILYEYGD